MKKLLLLSILFLSGCLAPAQNSVYTHDKEQLQKDSYNLKHEHDSLKRKHSVDSTLQILHDEIYHYYMDSIFGKYNLTKNQLFNSDYNPSYWMKSNCYVELLDYLNNGELLKWIWQYFGNPYYYGTITLDELYSLVKDKEDISCMILLKYGYKIDGYNSKK